MDLDAKEAKKTFNQPEKKPLSLEARHSISIEAANKIRSKLSPRIFMPKIPLTRHTDKFQYCSNKLKEFNSKCQAGILDNFVNRLKGKYTNTPQCDKHNKTMEDENRNDNNNVLRSLKRHHNIKILRKNMKRTPKDLKHCLEIAIDNLEKPMDIKFQDQEAARRKWGNLEDIANENAVDSTVYTNDGEIDDPLALDSPKPVCKDKNTEELFNKNTSNSNSTNSPAVIYKYITKTSKKRRNSKSASTKSDESCRKSTNQDQKDTTDEEINCEASLITKKYSKNIVEKRSDCLISKNSTNLADLENFTISLSRYKTTNTLIPKAVIKGTIQNIVGEINSTKSIKENPRAKSKDESRNLEAIQTRTHQQAVEQHKESTNEKKQHLMNKETITLKNNPSLQSTENFIAKHPLDRHLRTAATAVTDFQEAVRSSISLIYDCSPLDKTINEDLMNLEKCVEDFSKCILQSYDAAEQEKLAAKDFVSCLNKKYMNQRKMAEPNRSQTPSLNQQKPAEPTLTIFIEVEKMPKQSITFKSSDILCPKLISNNDKTSKISVLPLSTPTQNTKNFTNQNTDGAACNTQIYTKPSNINTDTQNIMNVENNARSHTKKRLRRKITPRNAKSLVSNTQTQISATTFSTPESFNTYETTTNPYNLNQTRAKHHNSCMAPDSLRLHGTAHKSSISTTSQIYTDSTISRPNCYNYYPAIEHLNTGRIPLPETHRAHSYPSSISFSREINLVRNENPNRSEYNSSLTRVQYLKNHYIHYQTQSSPYNFQ